MRGPNEQATNRARALRRAGRDAGVAGEEQVGT